MGEWTKVFFSMIMFVLGFTKAVQFCVYVLTSNVLIIKIIFWMKHNHHIMYGGVRLQVLVMLL